MCVCWGGGGEGPAALPCRGAYAATTASVSTPSFTHHSTHHSTSCSTQDDPPTYWPERSYRWGTAEAFNPEHSDLLFLRLGDARQPACLLTCLPVCPSAHLPACLPTHSMPLLFSLVWHPTRPPHLPITRPFPCRSLLMAEALEEVSVDKRARYEEWRRRQLSTPLFARLRRRLLRFAAFTLVPAAATVFAAHHGFEPARMRAAIIDGTTVARRRLLGADASAGCTTDDDASGDASLSAPVAGDTAHGAATAALREAEAAIAAAEAAQAAALQELQRRGGPSPAKKGWLW